jgi:hypothetical protein
MGNFLIIRGANFSDTAVDKVSFMSTQLDVQKELNNAELIVNTSSICDYKNNKGIFELTYRPRIRASIMVKKQYALKNTPWTNDGSRNGGRSYDNNMTIDEAHVQTHDMLSLPKSVKKITLNMTAPGYYYGLCVWGDKTGYISDSGWTEANVPIVKDLSTYPDDFFWITSTIKYGDIGNQYVGEITKEILGWSIKIEQS